MTFTQGQGLAYVASGRSVTVPQGGKLILALTDPSPRKRPEISSGAWGFPRKQISVLREGLSSC